jgi:predicted RNase H-like HicB family nuclease
MQRLIVVRAIWDREAAVWIAESEDVPGLVTEAETIENLEAKLPGLIQDLLDEDGSSIEIAVQCSATN